MVPVRQLIGPCLLAAAWAATGCATGPIVAREVLADPAMRFTGGHPVESPLEPADEPPTPMAPDTFSLNVQVASDPGDAVSGTWLDSTLRAAAELYGGLGIEAGYSVSRSQETVQKLDGFLGPLTFERTRHGPEAALVMDDGTSTLRLGYSYRTAWDGAEHAPSIVARTSILSRDTVVEVLYRHSRTGLQIDSHHRPAGEPVDASKKTDRVGAAIEQGLLPGWNLRLDLALQLAEGFLQSPYRLVSLWASRGLALPGTGPVPRTEPEKHPGSRARWGTLFRIKRALPALFSVLEAGIGYGADTWRVEHAKAQLFYLQRLGEQFSLSLGGGAYHQTAASFYRDDYTQGPTGSYWSADRELCSYLALWGETELGWIVIPQTGRALGVFKYLTLKAGGRLIVPDYRWESSGIRGFTAYPSVNGSTQVDTFAGGTTFAGWFSFEGGF